VPFEPSRRLDDPDAAFYRLLERHVLEHYPNPTRSGCFTSEVLKSVVYEPETLKIRNTSTSWNAQNAYGRSSDFEKQGWRKARRDKDSGPAHLSNGNQVGAGCQLHKVCKRQIRLETTRI
jgi:hypothetical protein